MFVNNKFLRKLRKVLDENRLPVIHFAGKRWWSASNRSISIPAVTLCLRANTGLPSPEVIKEYWYNTKLDTLMSFLGDL